MSLRLYMDENVRIEITRGLRGRGIDVVTAQDDGRANRPDPELLDRATELGRVLFTHDVDFLVEATARQRGDVQFGGVFYAHPQRVTIRQCVEDLELAARLYSPDEMANRVQHLPI